MEAACIVYLAINCVTLRLFVMRNIISDDDSTMWAHARHPQAEKGAKDKGKLPTWIFEPEFSADPGHRKKAVLAHFYKLANLKQSRETKYMAKRLKKNWGYMIMQNRLRPMSEFIKSSKSSTRAYVRQSYVLQRRLVQCFKSKSRR